MDSTNTQLTLDKEIYTVSAGTHKGNAVLWIAFSYTPERKNFVKQNFKARWSASEKKWYLPETTANCRLLGLPCETVGKELIAKVHPANAAALDDFRNMLLLKAYSQNTQRTYTVEFIQFLALLGPHQAAELSPEKLQSYFLYCIAQGISENYLHSRINAVKFFYEKVMHRPRMFLDIPRPKKPLLLPKSLNPKEVAKIIDVTENRKHRLIIKLVYGMGLRVSEIVTLRVEDIDSVTMRVLISGAKGKKDRYTNLPESILAELREYYKSYRPQHYLFEGQEGGQMSVRTAQSVFKEAMRKAKVRKKVGIHGLRHSYATHLLENGTDISLIQKLLGHNNIKTTLCYTHVAEQTVSAVKSPLDSLI